MGSFRKKSPIILCGALLETRSVRLVSSSFVMLSVGADTKAGEASWRVCSCVCLCGCVCVGVRVCMCVCMCV